MTTTKTPDIRVLHATVTLDALNNSDVVLFWDPLHEGEAQFKARVENYIRARRRRAISELEDRLSDLRTYIDDEEEGRMTDTDRTALRSIATHLVTLSCTTHTIGAASE